MRKDLALKELLGIFFVSFHQLIELFGQTFEMLLEFFLVGDEVRDFVERRLYFFGELGELVQGLLRSSCFLCRFYSHNFKTSLMPLSTPL